MVEEGFHVIILAHTKEQHCFCIFRFDSLVNKLFHIVKICAKISYILYTRISIQKAVFAKIDWPHRFQWTKIKKQ